MLASGTIAAGVGSDPASAPHADWITRPWMKTAHYAHWAHAWREGASLGLTGIDFSMNSGSVVECGMSGMRLQELRRTCVAIDLCDYGMLYAKTWRCDQ